MLLMLLLWLPQVKLMQTREVAADTDFSAITMDEDVESDLKEAAVISMGTEISSEDMSNIVELCDQVQSLRPCDAMWRPCAQPCAEPLSRL